MVMEDLNYETQVKRVGEIFRQNWKYGKRVTARHFMALGIWLSQQFTALLQAWRGLKLKKNRPKKVTLPVRPLGRYGPV